MMSFDELPGLLKGQPLRRVAVAVAQDKTVLEAVDRARGANIASATLVGRAREIQAEAEKSGIDLGRHTVIDEPDDIRAAAAAVSMVARGEADIVMKGHIHTDDFLRAVLQKENGLRAGVLMSHVFVIELRDPPRLLFITDGAMNISPNLEEKAEILLNAVHLANVFGMPHPKVAVLAAVELLNPKMQATVDATCLSKMSDRGQFYPPCTVDGPFALDNAISEAAAAHKKIGGPVAGKADILLVPNIEAGNMLTKCFVYFGKCRIAGLLVGASAPVVLTSRADSAESKMLSIASAVLMINMTRALRLKIGKVHY